MRPASTWIETSLTTCLSPKLLLRPVDVDGEAVIASAAPAARTSTGWPGVRPAAVPGAASTRNTSRSRALAAVDHRRGELRPRADVGDRAVRPAAAAVAGEAHRRGRAGRRRPPSRGTKKRSLTRSSGSRRQHRLVGRRPFAGLEEHVLDPGVGRGALGARSASRASAPRRPRPRPARTRASAARDLVLAARPAWRRRAAARGCRTWASAVSRAAAACVEPGAGRRRRAWRPAARRGAGRRWASRGPGLGGGELASNTASSAGRWPLRGVLRPAPRRRGRSAAAWSRWAAHLGADRSTNSGCAGGHPLAALAHSAARTGPATGAAR